MTVYALLWLLLKHALHGRGRDTVHASIEWDHGAIAGDVVDIYWTGDQDAMLMINANNTDGPWSES